MTESVIKKGRNGLGGSPTTTLQGNTSGNIFTDSTIAISGTMSGASTYNHYYTNYALSASAPTQSIYPSTAQPEQLVDFHARKDILEIRQQMSLLISRVDLLAQNFDYLVTRLHQGEETILSQIEEMFRGVSEVRSAYALKNEDGYEIIMTYLDSLSLTEFLESVVPVETEIDRKFKNTYFDFEHIPESEFSINDYQDAQLIFKT